MRYGIGIIAAVLVFSGILGAASPVGASDAFPLQVKQYGSVSYITGGMGLDERAALDQAGRDYNLKLSFALSGGKYIAGVSVVVKDAQGKVALEAVSDGPWVYARLPAGRYTVSTTFEGVTETRSVELAGTGQVVLNLFWKGAE